MAVSAVKKKFWKSYPEAIFVTMLILMIIGTINIFSASFIISEMSNQNSFHFLGRHVASMIVGFFAYVVACRVNYKKWENCSWVITFIVIISLVLVCLVGVQVNGARRWIPLVFGFRFQPSELAKIALIMLTASYLSRALDAKKEILLIHKTRREYWVNIICMGIIAALVFKEPDMGTAALICAVPFCMYWISLTESTLARNQFICIVVAIAVIVVYLCVSAPYRLDRVKSWYDPWSSSRNNGYQTTQSIIAIGSGGPLGMGFGEGVSKYAYLPEAHTDFAFAIWCQEEGIPGVLLVFFLYGMLLFYASRIVFRTKDNYGRLLSFGITSLFFIQGTYNMAMVIGMVPVVGVPLPFISYGGTALILNMFNIGILVNIGKSNVRQEKNAQRKSSQVALSQPTHLRRLK